MKSSHHQASTLINISKDVSSAILLSLITAILNRINPLGHLILISADWVAKGGRDEWSGRAVVCRFAPLLVLLEGPKLEYKFLIGLLTKEGHKANEDDDGRIY